MSGNLFWLSDEQWKRIEPFLPTDVRAVVIVTRFVWMYPATYLPRWLFPPLNAGPASPTTGGD